MAKQVRQVQPKLEALSYPALEVLHVLEPTVGRIIGTAVLKFACAKASIDPASLMYGDIPQLIPSIEQSLALYERSSEITEVLKRLATVADERRVKP